MIEYQWKILDADKQHNSLVVEYTAGANSMKLNLPYPKSGTIDEHVSQYVPSELFDNFANENINISVGDSGVGFHIGNIEVPEAPNVLGNWNEEYLRAVIYQVLTEIRETEA